MKENLYFVLEIIKNMTPLILALGSDAFVVGFVIYKLFQIPGNRKIGRKFKKQPKQKKSWLKTAAIATFIIAVNLLAIY